MRHTHKDFDTAVEKVVTLWLENIQKTTAPTLIQRVAFKTGFLVGAQWAKNWLEQEDD